MRHYRFDVELLALLLLLLTLLLLNSVALRWPSLFLSRRRNSEAELWLLATNSRLLMMPSLFVSSEPKSLEADVVPFTPVSVPVSDEADVLAVVLVPTLFVPVIPVPEVPVVPELVVDESAAVPLIEPVPPVVEPLDAEVPLPELPPELPVPAAIAGAVRTSVSAVIMMSDFVFMIVSFHC
jgi:hypothetical protein